MTKPAEHTQDELDALRKSDRVYFLTLFRDMLAAHQTQNRNLKQVIAYIDGVIANVERPA